MFTFVYTAIENGNLAYIYCRRTLTRNSWIH